MIELKVEKLFNSEGYTLLSNYQNQSSHLIYLCPSGHLHRITLEKFREKRRCPYCYHERLKGEGNPRFNPELSDEDRVLKRRTLELENWRKAVLERDNYQCFICGSNLNLNVHHIYSYRAYPSLRHEINNGVTLCQEHHKAFHQMFGYGDNTLVQFMKFWSIGTN